MYHEHSLSKPQLRKHRQSQRLRGTTQRPRLHVYRSNRYLYAQIIDDSKGITLAGVTDKEVAATVKTKTARATALGTLLVQKIKLKNITQVKFDRAQYRYHGRIKAFATSARLAGLKF